MSTSLPNPCLLESGQLPILELASFAAREGRRPRPIYTAHKWFARRLGSVFRALLVGATSAPESSFWDQYYGGADLRDVVVLDPFLGGGTSLVEALRLGATTHGVDIDPVACAVSSFEVCVDQMPDLTEALDELSRSVGRAIRRFHVRKGLDGTEHVVLHHFWVQVVRCDACGHVFDAHPNFVLGENRTHRWVICSRCGDVHRRHVRHQRFRCGSCGTRTHVMEGHVKYGAACCPRCRNRRALIAVGRDSHTTPTWRLFALEVLDEPDGGRPVPMAKRRFLKASADDVELYEAAQAELRMRLDAQPATLPQEPLISPNRSDPRLLAYGYRHWTELFNARQLLHLSRLSEAISKYDGSVREGLAIAFSSHLTTNCMMAGYAARWRRLTPLFSIRAFRHVQRPVEINPWCDGTGRGTFPNAVKKLMRASQFARAPKEPTMEGGFKPVESRDPHEPPNVVCGTAKDLGFLADCSVDLVLTDPPYLDNISYSELAEFFAPWLEFLKVVNDPRTRRRVAMQSLVGSREDAASVDRYAEGLGSAFVEVARVLKSDGLLVFSFRHTSPQAWIALAQGLARSTLRVSAYLPVPGEAGIGLHTHTGTGLWDAVFVLRKIPGTVPLNNLQLSARQIQKAKELVATWSATLKEALVRFSAADELALLRAGLVGTALGVESPGNDVATIALDFVLATSPSSEVP